jgi:large subunit ribosomal protein L19
MNEIKSIETSQMKEKPDDFKVGDTVKVHFKIVEGKTERIQVYEGLVIAFKNGRIQKLYGTEKFLRRWC